MNTTTDTTISLNDIRSLRADAAEAGDDEMVDLCDRALFLDDGTEGYARALSACEQAIKSARRMNENTIRSKP